VQLPGVRSLPAQFRILLELSAAEQPDAVRSARVQRAETAFYAQPRRVLVSPHTRWGAVRNLVQRHLFRGALAQHEFRLLFFGVYLDPAASVAANVRVGDITDDDGRPRDVIVDLYVPRS